MNKKMFLSAAKDFSADDVKTSGLTHLIISSARVGADFRISDTDERLSVGDKGEVALPDLLRVDILNNVKWNEINKIKQKSAGLKTIISVGGPGADGLSDMCASAITRRIFAESAAEYINRRNLDGIDIDWQYPTISGRSKTRARRQDRETFVLLLKELRDCLGKSKEISYCAHPAGWFFDAVDLYEMCRYTNDIHIMTHGMSGVSDTETRHHSAIYANPKDPHEYAAETVDTAVNRYLEIQMPPETLYVAYAAYGREFRGVSGAQASEQNGLYQKYGSQETHIWKGNIIPYAILESYFIDKNGYTRYWDDYSKAPYLYSETEKTFITYEDPESVGEKLTYISGMNLGGIVGFEYSMDKNAVLLQSLNK